MKHLSKGEIAHYIVDLTKEYTSLYHKHVDPTGEIVNKQIWAALHLGFLTAMEINGYTDAELDLALQLAQNQLLQDFEHSDYESLG